MSIGCDLTFLRGIYDGVSSTLLPTPVKNIKESKREGAFTRQIEFNEKMRARKEELFKKFKEANAKNLEQTTTDKAGSKSKSLDYTW